MRYATFMTTVEQAAGIPPEQAERAVDAVLRTLAERITAGEASDVAAFLPKEVRAPLLSAPSRAEAFPLTEFTRRVAEREGVEEQTAAEHIRAVFIALGQAVAPGELRDMVAQLPKDFDPLLEAAGVSARRAPQPPPRREEPASETDGSVPVAPPVTGPPRAAPPKPRSESNPRSG
jgi:uncharacterized protein (DUF2267 family)